MHSQGDSGAVLAPFVADAPTATLQRLKALLTGGMPTFFDISRSFSAGALQEDNLVHQLVAAGKRAVRLLCAGLAFIARLSAQAHISQERLHSRCSLETTHGFVCCRTPSRGPHPMRPSTCTTSTPQTTASGR